jgi:hypothetical protein
MIRYFILFFWAYCFGADIFDNSFITKYEYGKMLYENPRGISCNKCHGDDATGKVIVRFEQTFNKKRYICEIKSSDITNLSYEQFKRFLDPKLEKPKKQFTKEQRCEKFTYGNSMPTYFLTDEELESIHFYLVNKGSRKYE